MHEIDEDDDFISKSELKREAQELQVLGNTLVSWSKKKLLDLNLGDALLNAILEAKRLKAHGAKRRQLQYIGKLMRGVDSAPIYAAIEAEQIKHQQSAKQFHELENWRDRLISEGDTAINELLEQFPQLDRQQLRQTALQARSGKSDAARKKASRRLFQLIKEVTTL